MAYDRTKLLHIGGVSPLPQVWQYFSSDSVTAKGYIPKEEGVNAGDQVEVVNITKSSGLITAYSATKYYALADANGDLTLTAYNEGSEAALANRVTAIEAVIPTEASADNQLADKAYVTTNFEPKAQ